MPDSHSSIRGLIRGWLFQSPPTFPAAVKPSTNTTRIHECQTPIRRRFVVSFVDGSLNLPQRFLLRSNRPRIPHEFTNARLPFAEGSWSHSWMAFFMRGFAMFGQVNVGGTEEYFHGVVPY